MSHDPNTNLSLKDMPGEVWKPIVGFEGIYEVSNLGRVKSLARVEYLPNMVRSRKARILMSVPHNKNRYRNLDLRNGNGKRKPISVHRLVAAAFIPNPNNYKEVNHIDSDRGNNKLENLEWVSAQENISHAHSKGVFSAATNPNKAWNTKLTPEQVSVIKRRLLDKDPSTPFSSIAREFGITRSMLDGVRNGWTWASVAPAPALGESNV